MPTMTSIEPSKTGTRECRCSRSAGRIRSTGVATSRQNMSGRGTMVDRTSVSSSSKTLWLISRSSRSTTPSLAPTSTRVRSSSSESSGSADRALPMSRTVSAVSPPQEHAHRSEQQPEPADRALDESQDLLRVLHRQRHRQDLAEGREDEDRADDLDGE